MGTNEATFVVIGGGVAAVACVEQLADACPNEPIIVLTASSLVKMVANLQQVGRTMDTFDVKEAAASSVFDRFTNVKVVPAMCTKIDITNKQVFTSSGERYKFKKLLIAAGGRPKIFGDNPQIIGIRDTESVEDFQHRLKKCRRVAVVGNGGIATELVFELENVEILWVVRHKSVSAAFVDAGAAEFLISSLLMRNERRNHGQVKKRLKYVHDSGVADRRSATATVPASALGPDWVEDLTLSGTSERKLTVEYESEVAQVLSPEEAKRVPNESDVGEWPVYVLLSNGKLYGCDLIVSATGVIPNSDFITGNNDMCHLASDGGICVNDQMQAFTPDIYSAGDVCTANWTLAPQWFQMRLWTQARQMGSFAGRCMANHFLNNESRVEPDICFEIFTHLTRFFGFKVVLLGLFNGQKLGTNYEVLLRIKKDDEYVKIVVADDRIQGAILIGDTDLEETLENLILNRTDISQIKDDLLNPTVDIEDYFD